MSLVVDVSTDGVRAPVARDRVRAVATAVLRAEGIRHALLSIALVSSREIARLNRRHLAHAGTTDVISFALRSPARRRGPDAIVGDVYIAPDVARQNAVRLGHGVREEVARLVVHGVLHVLGHDHPLDETRTTSSMWKRQEQLLRSAVVRRAIGGARSP